MATRIIGDKGLAEKPVTLPVIKRLLELFQEQHVTDQTIQQLLRCGLLVDLLQTEDPSLVDRAAFQKILGVYVDLNTIFTVRVDWNNCLEKKIDRLRQLGFTFINPDINSDHFPNPDSKRGQETVKFVIPVSRNLYAQSPKQHLENLGATLSHPQVVLDWLIKYYPKLKPFMTKGFYVTALGLKWPNLHNHFCVVCLCCHASGRTLDLRPINSNWEGWRIAGELKQ